MKIDLISDTHEQHHQLFDLFNSKSDIIIHAGDEANHKNPTINNNASREFFEWYSSLPHKQKIFVPGNHSTAISNNLIKPEDFPEIIFLIHRTIVINGIKFFGSPYTPTFGTNWAYNKSRTKINRYWEQIPEDTDILITHGPPFGILDSTKENGRSDRGEKIFAHVGDSALLKRVIKINPKYHIFGHLHDEEYVLNHGFRRINSCDTTFINASVVDLKSNFKNEHLTIEI